MLEVIYQPYLHKFQQILIGMPCQVKTHSHAKAEQTSRLSRLLWHHIGLHFLAHMLILLKNYFSTSVHGGKKKKKSEARKDRKRRW